MATIQEVYIALFGRPADPIGYNYYVEATDDGANLDAVGDLSNSEEYMERFEGLTDAQKVNQIYQDLFGRQADAAGLTFYTNLLASGAATEQSIAIQILDGATGTDREIIDNKVASAQAFTDSLDTAEEILAYQGEEAAELGREYLDGITADDTTVKTEAQAQAYITAQVVPNAPQGPVGMTVPLTDKVESVSGGSLNDTFNGVSDTTLQAGDVIDGKGGTDTLNITLQADVGAGVSVSNVEIVNARNVDGGTPHSVNAVSFSGVQQLWNDRSLTGSDVTFNNVSAAATIGVRGTSSDTTANFGAGVFSGKTDTVNVALEGASGGDLTINADGTENVETVSVMSGGTGANKLGTLEVDGAETLNLTGKQNLELTVDGDVETVSAANLGGKLTIDLSAVAASGIDDLKFTGSAQDDTITTSDTDDDDVIDGGAGNDTLIVTGSFGAKLTNVENLTVKTGNAPDIDLENAQSIGVVNVEASAALTDFTFENAADDIVVNIKNNNNSTYASGELTLEDDGSSDEATLNFTGNGTVTFNGGKVDIGGLETLNLSSVSDLTLNQADLFGADGTEDELETINFSGSGDVDVDASLFDNNSLTTVNASALTGDFSNEGVTINGGGAIEIMGGSGNDTIVGAGGNDTLSGGDGNNDIDGKAGSNEIDLAGNGNNTVSISVAGYNEISGFNSGDVVDIELAAGKGGEQSVTTQLAAQYDPTDTFTVVVTLDASEDSITTGGTQTIADFTDLADVAAYLDEGFDVEANEDFVFVLNDGEDSYVYSVANGGDTTIADTEVSLIGMVDGYVLGTGDVTQS
ncbi:hemolysin-type calcium-binding region [Devosia pacifica]|uniref:Hemolysin-type calcium-binding region n=1 Tax=Devosia pacifica TaxID=1335967 RepID=A0A918S0M2_9HYPH|nr:DUF4214 domain-containing protein [Devosia pacifica]GHA18266.1 hemolysin-type calcium-binding region [Devosia pacifica]